MFPQLKKVNNESGIVLFMVLMTAIIIMIFSVAILSQSMNEINYAQQQIDQIATDQLAKGVFWNAFSDSFGSNYLTEFNSYYVENNRNYIITFVNNGFDPTQNSTNYSVNATYDTFQ